MNTLDQDIESCSSVIAATHKGFTASGRLIADACDRHPGFIDALHKALRGSVSVTYLRRLERCGRGELIPELVVCVGPAQAWLEKLSVQDQKKAIKGIAWPVGGDDSDTRIKLVSDMSYDEAKACFWGGVIGSPDTIRIKAQAIMERNQALDDARNQHYAKYEKQHRKSIEKVTKIGIVIKKEYIIWNGTKLTTDDLSAMITEAERKAK